MSEREALHRAICENPDEDTPRLVFADWLDEHDEPERAEFIRLQIEIAGLPEGKKKQKRQVREKELLDAHKEAWTESLALYGKAYRNNPFEFRRGFVERIEMDGGTFAARGGELFDLAPIREVAFPELESFAVLAKCKSFLRLKTLVLTGARLTTEYFDTAKLLRSKYLANLTTLIARGYDDHGHLDAGGLRAVAGSRHFTKLVRLDISNNWMFGRHQHLPRAVACLKALWKLGENKPALGELLLRNVGFYDEDLIGLVGQSWMGQLRLLDLSRNSITEEGCRVLCESKNLSNLEQVILTNNKYYDRVANVDIPLGPAAQRMLKKRFGKAVVL